MYAYVSEKKLKNVTKNPSFLSKKLTRLMYHPLIELFINFSETSRKVSSP